ncbi:MAG: hypothetical protein JST80_13710 [Bdellovibrionales bacterium]|nr:hypothetical protein [Bdellovibrionales bacterium]
MATATTTTTEKGKLGRRALRKVARDKRKLKLKVDKEFATKYFSDKSKRSGEKKVAFRKKKNKK